MVLEYPAINGLMFVYKNLRDKKLLLYSFLSSLVIFLIPLIISVFLVLRIFFQSAISIVVLSLVLLSLILIFLNLNLRLFKRSLELAKITPTKISFFEFLKFYIKYLLVNLTFWYEKKLLLLSIFLFLITLVSFFFTKLLFFYFLAISIIFYLIIFILHSTRTYFSIFFFLLGDSEPLKKSYYLVKGQTMEIFISVYAFASLLFYFFNTFIFLSFVFFIIYFIVAFVSLIFYILSLILFQTDMFLFYYNSLGKSLKLSYSKK